MIIITITITVTITVKVAVTDNDNNNDNETIMMMIMIVISNIVITYLTRITASVLEKTAINAGPAKKKCLLIPIPGAEPGPPG